MEGFNLPPFYVGQKVVCVNHGGWEDEANPNISRGPKMNETCTVAAVEFNSGEWLIELREYPKIYSTEGDWFRVRCVKPQMVLFVPAQTMKYPLVEYSKVIEKEKVLVSSN